MKLLNEAHELGNGWGFYIDTDIDNNTYNSYSYVNSSSFKYKNMNIIPEISDTKKNKYNDNTEIDEKIVNIDTISIISLTFTCLFAFLIH